MQEYTKMRIPDKRYRSNTVHTFWGTRSTSAFRYLGLDHFGRFSMKICEIILASLKSWWGFVVVLNIGYFPFLDGISLYGWKHSGRAVREACTVLQEVIIFSWCSRGSSLIEINLKKWILSTKSSCIKRWRKMVFIWGLWCATEDIPGDTCTY